MHKHMEKNKKDKDSKFRLVLVESRIHRLARYYRRTKQLPANWKSAAFACHYQSILRFCPDSARFQLHRSRFLQKKKEK